jgi:hypothetical protein
MANGKIHHRAAMRRKRMSAVMLAFALATCAYQALPGEAVNRAKLKKMTRKVTRKPVPITTTVPKPSPPRKPNACEILSRIDLAKYSRYYPQSWSPSAIYFDLLPLPDHLFTQPLEYWKTVDLSKSEPGSGRRCSAMWIEPFYVDQDTRHDMRAIMNVGWGTEETWSQNQRYSLEPFADRMIQGVYGWTKFAKERGGLFRPFPGCNLTNYFLGEYTQISVQTLTDEISIDRTCVIADELLVDYLNVLNSTKLPNAP